MASKRRAGNIASWALRELKRNFAALHDGPEDPTAGVIGLRAWAARYSSTGRTHPRGRSWHWNPLARDPEVHVHGDGHTTAHPGSLGHKDVIDPVEQLLRAAGLTPEEVQVAQLQGEGLRRSAIGQRLGLPLRQVEQLITRANRRLAEYASALRELQREAS